MVDGLRSSNRRVWWTSFATVTILCALWAFANPLLAGPDEPSHVLRAVAIDRGQLTGRSLTPAFREQFKHDRLDYLLVRVPAFYASNATSCFARVGSRTAECLRFTNSTREVDGATYVARHPPAYYAIVGVASRITHPGTAALYLMRLITAAITGALIATAITALRRAAAPKLLVVGLALAITPMVLFVSSIVNPSGPEVAAAIAVWVCGLLAVLRAHERVDRWLVGATGIAGCVLALTRQLGPLWLAIIALTLLGVSNRAALRNLARDNWARLWTFLIAGACIVQMAWNVIIKPLDVSRSGGARVNIEMSDIVRIVTGRGFFRYKEMIGVFGWLDTPAPAVTWLPWTAAVVFLFFAAVVWASRRYVAVLFALLAVVVIVPIVIESAAYGDAGGLSWQGRYTLPIAVGVPILAAFALTTTERGRQLVSRRFLLVTGVVLAAAQAFAFAQNLRRYTVGYDGAVQFWKHPDWTPPVSPLLLTILYLVVIGAFVAWLLGAVPVRAGDPDAADAENGGGSGQDLVRNLRATNQYAASNASSGSSHAGSG
jgi:hypothetical protein